MASADDQHQCCHVTDTATGKALRSFPLEGKAPFLAFSADGDTLIRANGTIRGKERRTWAVESVKGPPPTTPGLAGKDALLFSPAGHFLISAELAPKGGAVLRVHDASKGYAVMARRSDAHFGPSLAASADGARLVVADRALGESSASRWQRGPSPEPARLTVLSLPGLRRISECRVALSRHGALSSLALSPDGKLLAVAVEGEGVPALFRTETGERIRPTSGHNGAIAGAYFSADGKSVRTLGRDNRVCIWDRKTLRLLKSISLPDSFEVLRGREPGGKFFACIDQAVTDKTILRIVDADTGRTTFTFTFPNSDSRNDHFFWLGEHKAVYSRGKKLFLLDCAAGKVLKELAWETSYQLSALARAPDGKSLYAYAHSTGMISYCKAWSLPLKRGKAQELAQQDEGGLDFGLVPGERYVYLASPKFRLLRRADLRVVTSRSFRGMDLRPLSFSGDGGRYAVTASGERGSALPLADRRITSVVRVHDTLSGKTLGAFPASPSRLRLSPDGRQLVVVDGDNALALWDLTRLAKKAPSR